MDTVPPETPDVVYFYGGEDGSYPVPEGPIPLSSLSRGLLSYLVQCLRP